MTAPRFEDVISRQLDLFEQEYAHLLEACDLAERAYDEAGREDAEERYADYLNLVEEGTEILAGMRGHYAAGLEEDLAVSYAGAFNRAVERRLPRFALGIEDA